MWKYVYQIWSDLVVPNARYGAMHGYLNWRNQKGRFQAANGACARRAIGLVVPSRELARHDVTVVGRSCYDLQTVTPDLNPDYKVWSVLQERVYRSLIRDVELLKVHLAEEWKMFSQNMVDTAVKQWRLRLQACVLSADGNFECIEISSGSALFYSTSNRHISRLVVPKRVKFGTHIFTYC